LVTADLPAANSPPGELAAFLFWSIHAGRFWKMDNGWCAMSRRVAKVRISIELFENILTCRWGSHPTHRLETNAPQDLRVWGFAPVETEPFLMTVYMFVESESFEEVAEGAQPPEIMPFQYSLIEVEHA
jgi:hypothetical protein